MTGRMRPGATYNDPNFNSDHWFGPFSQFNSSYNKNRSIAAFDAFPSGHTGAIFAMATVFSEQYKEAAFSGSLFCVDPFRKVYASCLSPQHEQSQDLPSAFIASCCASVIVACEACPSLSFIGQDSG